MDWISTLVENELNHETRVRGSVEMKFSVHTSEKSKHSINQSDFGISLDHEVREKAFIVG